MGVDSKTKLMIAGTSREDTNQQPLTIGGEEIETVSAFRYLGAIVEGNGNIMSDVERRVAKASRAFGALRRTVFKEKDLTLKTKRLVYRPVVLGILLYDAETWAMNSKRVHSRKFEVFHNRCLRAIMGITTEQQRTNHISSVQVSQMFGMEESMEDLILRRRLRWLGHVARMDDSCLPRRAVWVATTTLPTARDEAEMER